MDEVRRRDLQINALTRTNAKVVCPAASASKIAERTGVPRASVDTKSAVKDTIVPTMTAEKAIPPPKSLPPPGPRSHICKCWTIGLKKCLSPRQFGAYPPTLPRIARSCGAGPLVVSAPEKSKGRRWRSRCIMAIFRTAWTSARSSRSTARRWDSTRIATGSASCSSRAETGTLIWSRSRAARRRHHASPPCSPTPGTLKLFHFGRFDIAVLLHAFGSLATPVYCTKIASKLGAHLHRQAWAEESLRGNSSASTSPSSRQSSDWGPETLTEAQLEYAASDVLHLHSLREVFDARLARKGDATSQKPHFAFLPTRARSILADGPIPIFFSH